MIFGEHYGQLCCFNSPMLPPILSGWKSLLSAESRKPYYRALDAFLKKELAGGETVLPARKDIFNALAATSYDQVRVLLVGQDPYPTPGHAHGICFSLQPRLVFVLWTSSPKAADVDHAFTSCAGMPLGPHRLDQRICRNHQ
jgi:hypothetical protein